MVRAINRKLLRDLKGLSGQIVTICLVVASGVAAFIAMQTAYRSLHDSKQHYYQDYRFADLFAQARRAPLRVADRLLDVPGVALVYPRITGAIRIPLQDSERAVSGRIVSLPDRGRPPLNNLYVRKGRLPTNSSEALVLDIFATHHKIEPGDQLEIVVEGTQRGVTVSGIAMSPEYVFALGGDVLSYEPGSFGVLWMTEASVAPLFDMKGAFNDVVFRLQPGASEASVIEGVDQILRPYGGFGSFGRDRHVSDHFVSNELKGLEVQAIFIPFIFLAVAAFLVNVVLGRLVQLQRGQIATLKALGYSNLDVGLHYLKLVSVIVLSGSAIGIAAGSWMGAALIGVYKNYFQFPVFEHSLTVQVVLTAFGISFLTAAAGAFMSVRGIVSLPPAEAMKPPAPPAYKTTILDTISHFVLGSLGRMVARDLWRRPLRVSVSVFGIAMAVAIVVIGRFAGDSINGLMDLHFGRSMLEDISVSLKTPVPKSALQTMLQIPGVSHAEGIRNVPVRIRAGSAFRDTVIMGIGEESRLRHVLNREGRTISLPLRGLMLTDVLADKLGVRARDTVTLEVLEGDRRKVEVVVGGKVSDMLGMQGYMRYEELEGLLGERSLLNSVLLSVDAESIAEAERRLYRMPSVLALTKPADARASFERQQGGSMMAMNAVLVFFACVIAIGIVYNNARVSLSMRSRDLASMRVLGFTRAEISSVLLGELAVQVLAALPIGMWIGSQAAGALLSVDPENFRMPLMISAETYAFSALVTLGAALVSGLLVRRKLDRLDLIGVLKTRE